MLHPLCRCLVLLLLGSWLAGCSSNTKDDTSRTSEIIKSTLKGPKGVTIQ